MQNNFLGMIFLLFEQVSIYAICTCALIYTSKYRLHTNLNERDNWLFIIAVHVQRVKTSLAAIK